MNELSLIKEIEKIFKRSKDQINKVNESDSELVKIGNDVFAFNIDEYSGEEDYFSTAKPEILGRNLVIATMSDLLAVGAEPQFFLHTYAYPESHDIEFIKKLCKGIEYGLRLNDAFLLGGDVSRDEKWHYVGCAIGRIKDNIVNRIAESEEIILMATGNFGDGNLGAMNPEYTAVFDSRLNESRDFREIMELAIDSSDGLRSALHTFLSVNENYNITIDMDSIEYHKDVLAFCQNMGIRKEGFLFGGAGEYELVFGVSKLNYEHHKEKLDANKNIKTIGSMKLNDTPGLFWTKNNKIISDLPLTIDPRTNQDREAYIKEILSNVGMMFYKN